VDRRDIILSGLKLDGLGLEVGGSYMPLAGGWPGLNVRTLDHLDTEALVAKYEAMGVDTAKVVPVDYVWRGERYRDLVGDTRFDWIVASHVIEHVPDLIAFVNQCAEILADDGILTLAIPDRRYTFDYFRPETGLSELIDAHLQGRTVSSPGAVAEHFLYYSELSGHGTWNSAAEAEPTLAIPPKLAAEKFAQARKGGYIDAHAWTFTPSSFRLALHDLHALDLLTVREARFHDAVECEFFVQLSRSGAGPSETRQQLAERAQAERVLGYPEARRTAARLQAALAELERLRGAGTVAPPAETASAALEIENERLRAAVEEIRASSSWRMTAPLRAAVSAVRGRPASTP
jgi:SAM-dependent methyltransferase